MDPETKLIQLIHQYGDPTLDLDTTVAHIGMKVVHALEDEYNIWILMSDYLYMHSYRELLDYIKQILLERIVFKDNTLGSRGPSCDEIEEKC